MDVSQPLAIAAAFVAGLGFMIVVRFVWLVLKHSIQLVLVAAVLFALVNGMPEGKDSAWSGVQARLEQGREFAGGLLSQARSWASEQEVELKLVPKT